MSKAHKHNEASAPTHQQIADRAYYIYLANGCQEGHAQDDWLQAQYELLQQPIREVVKLNPAKTSLVPVHLTLLTGVVQSALWLTQHGQ